MSKKMAGFTLIEIMLVITIIGVLMMVLLPQLTGRSVDSRIASTRIGLQAVGAAIARCEMDTTYIPATDALYALTYTLGEIQTALASISPAPVTFPESDKGQVWNGPYLMKKQLIDAWKMPFKYTNITPSPPVYKLYSFGPDKTDATGDDIEFVP